MPNCLPPRLRTYAAVTIYFVQTYNIRVLAGGVPKKTWGWIMSFYRELALVLTICRASSSFVELGTHTHTLLGIGLLSPQPRFP